MKKVLIAFTALIWFSLPGMAQAVKKTDDKPKTVTAVKPVAAAKVVEMPKTAAKTPAAVKPVATTPAVAKPQAATTKPPIVLKKDGTPDKRYNTTPTPAGPVKKDGTPDMRYNKNKKGKSK
ncbi:MAG: hypothetical protein IPP81_09040 [Chitinophagaceae bacterium]|nr:hypothetical protein [Chitinophagaceae bacterium]